MNNPTPVSRMTPRPVSPSEREARLREATNFVATATPPGAADPAVPEEPAAVEAAPTFHAGLHQPDAFPTPWVGKSPDHMKQCPFRMPEDEKEMLNFLGDTTYSETNQSIFLASVRATMATMFRQRGYIASQDPATGKLTVTAPKKRK